MYISLSAVNPHSVDAAIKCMIALYKTRDFLYDGAFIQKLQMWADESKDFATRFKIVVPFNKAMRLIINGRDVAEHKDAKEAVDALFAKLKELRSTIDKETDITRTQLNLINDIRLAHTGSESAEKRLMRSVSFLRDPDINEMFLHIEEATDAMQDIYNRLQALVKKYGKVSGYEMPASVLKEWQDYNKQKGAKFPAHEEYLALRRECNDFYKKQLANIVRSSGQQYLPTHEVKRQLGNILNPIPEGFVGMIDDLGKYYTTAGLQLLQTPVGDVRMNQAYNAKEDNTSVCEFKGPFSEGYSKAYTVDYRQGRRADKFSVVAEVLPQLEKLTKAWLPDLKKGPGTREGCAAAICEMVYQTSGRIGSIAAKTDGKTTYGLTTLLMRHVNLNDQRIIMNYTGKSGGKQRHVVKFNTQRGEMLHSALMHFAANKKPADYLTTFKAKPLTSGVINSYLREIGFPEGFTIHKVRTAKGTEMAMKLLANPPFKKGTAKGSDVDKWVEAQCTKIGAELGHLSGDEVTANTAIANYIDPSVLEQLYAKLGVRPSSKIQKAIDSIKKD